MPRISAAVNESWEDVTLALFIRHRREAGGPDYEFVRKYDRPDRVIRVVGSTEEIGVEITRCVVGKDAAAEKRTVALADALRRELSSWAEGGWVHLYGGDFPDCEKNAVERLVTALRDAIRATGSLHSFLASLDRGLWEHEDTVFHISSDPDDARWEIADNHLPSRPGRRTASPDEIERLLLERIHDKATKARHYGWSGPLILLVRNPYQVHRPDARTVEEAGQLLRPTFREAWLVNATEGVRDRSPPEPRLVPLMLS